MAITTGALLGAAGLGAAGSLLSGILGSSSQSSTNKMNAELTRETNQQNRDMFNQQLAWQEDMWNKTNSYNSPSHQVELLQRAGINPAAVYGTGSTSPASMPSVPSPNAMQTAEMRPVDYSWLGNIVDNGVSAYLNNNILNNSIDKSKYDSQIAKVEAEFSSKTLMDRCLQTMNNAKASEFEKNIARITMEVMESTKQQNILQSEWSTKIMAKNYEEAVNRIAESELQQEALRIQNQYAPSLNEASLKQFRANISALYASAANQNAQAVESAARKIFTDLQSDGVKIDNRQKRIISSSLISKAQEEAKQAKETTTSLQARNLYGEARQRLVGSYPIKIEPTSVDKGASKVFNFYQRGVKRGLEKNKRKVNTGW